jgi:hypothetical protein
MTVTLYDAQEGGAVVKGTTKSDASGKFFFDHPDPGADGVFYLTAGNGSNVLLVTVIGEVFRGTVTLNELTTVAAAYSMARFTDGISIQGHPFALRIAAGMNANLVETKTGDPSSVLLNPPNADQTNALRSTRSLANLLAPAVRDPGGDAWATLRGLTTPPGESGPANTFQAMVNIAHAPERNALAIYRQSKEADVYQPPLDRPPLGWTLAVKVNDTGDPSTPFGGPANVSFDRNGYAWVANNVVQGTPNSGTFIVVLKPDGTPSDGTDGTPPSPLYGGGMLGPGFGIHVDDEQHVWVGSFGWGKNEPDQPPNVPTEGIVSEFNLDGTPVSADGYIGGTLRVQGITSDRDGNIWAASFGNDKVVVFPQGDPDNPVAFPATQEAQDDWPGKCTFAVAVDRKDDNMVAWVTWCGGLGWPKKNPGYVAQLRLEGGTTLKDVWTGKVGEVTKGVAVDSQHCAWVASGGDNTVYRITPTGEVTGFQHEVGIDGPWDVAVDADDVVWIANFGQMGICQDYTHPCVFALAATARPGYEVGDPMMQFGLRLPSAGEPVTLPGGAPLYKDGTECYSPLMRMTSVNVDAAGNLWAVNNWKPRFGTDFPPGHGNPGGDGLVIFVGVAAPRNVP